MNYLFEVIGLARRTDRMDELSKIVENQPGKFYPIRCDVSREENILRAFKWIKENIGPVHILINNAGLIRPTSLTGTEAFNIFAYANSFENY